MIEHPILYLEDDAAWEAWLEEHHATDAGARLAIAKKSSAEASVSHAEALDTALCFGWIDARRNALDDDRFLQTFVPRSARSVWSQINRQKVQHLIEIGRMREAGLREIERAKSDGRWDAAYHSQKTIEVPPDLADALAASPDAAAFFATLTSQNRYAILYRLGSVKREETRTRKLGEFVAMLERGETIYPQKAKKS
jgi:uncharacterized protein YdeI (YjbR/CyaY-like superfamily)